MSQRSLFQTVVVQFNNRRHPGSTLSCYQQVASPTEQRLGEYGCAVGHSLSTGWCLVAQPPTRQRLAAPHRPSRPQASLPPSSVRGCPQPAWPPPPRLPTTRPMLPPSKGASLSHIKFLKNCQHQFFGLLQNLSPGRCNCTKRPCPRYRIRPNRSC